MLCISINIDIMQVLHVYGLSYKPLNFSLFRREFVQNGNSTIVEAAF